MYILRFKKKFVVNQLCFSSFCSIKSSFNDISYLDNNLNDLQQRCAKLHAFRHTEKFCSNVLYSGCTVQDLYSLAATSSCTTVYSQNNMAVSLGIVFCNKKSEITMFSFWKVSIM